MNAGAYGTQIGSYVREVKLYRAAARRLETLRGQQISFEYRHTSFAPDDMMLSVKLELPSKPYPEILQGIRICNEKRRASQPLGQKSAGCIFKNPPGASAGRMIDELGLKGFAVGDARVSERHANFFINAGHASAADMLALIAGVRERVRRAYGASGSRLYVANMASDALAVIDTQKLTEKASRTGMVEPDGFVPTEWMPISMAFLPSDSGGRLFVATDKGKGTGPNPYPPSFRSKWKMECRRGPVTLRPCCMDL